MLQKFVLSSSCSVITRLTSRRHKLQRKHPCSAQTNGSSVRTNIPQQFIEIVRKIESLYRNDAARQVEAAQRNVLADYGELYQLRKDVKTLIENNDVLKSTLETMLDQFANPSLRLKIFAIADALAGGTPVAISSGGGGGGNADSDLRWDGRRPDEEEEAYRRRCLLCAIRIVNTPSKKSMHR